MIIVADWKFDEKIVPIFDEHVRKSVPLYDEIHKLVADISGWFIEDNTNVYDIGTSTGEVLKNLTKLYERKGTNYVGIDTSKEMTDKASEYFKNDSNVYIKNVDVLDRNFKIQNASLITSLLTLQFIPQRNRQALVNKTYSGLNSGGAFILVEKIVGNNARFDEMWVELYHELKIKNGITEAEVFSKARALRGVMRPYTVNENFSLLDRAGFKDVDMFFKWSNFAGFIAIK